jgi:hypothetical protein
MMEIFHPVFMSFLTTETAVKGRKASPYYQKTLTTLLFEIGLFSNTSPGHPVKASTP